MRYASVRTGTPATHRATAVASPGKRYQSTPSPAEEQFGNQDDVHDDDDDAHQPDQGFVRTEDTGHLDAVRIRPDMRGPRCLRGVDYRLRPVRGFAVLHPEPALTASEHRPGTLLEFNARLT